jgi:SAM-dependent methyltransferase
VLDSAGFDTIPPASLDVVAVVSVVQYLPREELRRLLDRWHAQLRPGGRVVIGDVIPPSIGPLSDRLAVLAYCRRNGALLPAIRSIVATALSDYRRVHRAVGLTRYDETEIRDLLGSHGFAVTRHARNLGVNQARMTLVGRRLACRSDGRAGRAR